MCERPIIFSAESVRSILAGTKTQTRRVLKVDKHGTVPVMHMGQRCFVYVDFDGVPGLSWRPYGGAPTQPYPHPENACPYGRPGDKLWVREAWARRLDEDHLSPRELPGDWAWYWADPQTQQTGCAGAAGRKRSPLHLPRRLSRITLYVIAVRVQRLQEISDEDCYAELPKLRGRVWPRLEFRELWDSVNGKRAPWRENPLVWAIEVARVGA